MMKLYLNLRPHDKWSNHKYELEIKPEYVDIFREILNNRYQ